MGYSPSHAKKEQGWLPCMAKGKSLKYPEPRTAGGQASLCIAWLQESSSWSRENRKQFDEEAEIESCTWLVEHRLTDYLPCLEGRRLPKDTVGTCEKLFI